MRKAERGKRRAERGEGRNMREERVGGFSNAVEGIGKYGCTNTTAKDVPDIMLSMEILKSKKEKFL